MPNVASGSGFRAVDAPPIDVALTPATDSPEEADQPGAGSGPAETKISKEYLRDRPRLAPCGCVRLRVELHASRVDRLWSLYDRALDVVEEHLDEGDLQAAAMLIRASRFNPP